MSVIQHKLARQVLELIREESSTHGLLTYQSVAKALGRPTKNERAIANACDLLDAAAAIANIPLLALVAVRATSGEINPKAWVKDTPAGIREAIIKQSLTHSFIEEDLTAIEKSLDELSGYGNNAAWEEVRRRIPNLYEKLTSTAKCKEEDRASDAINDLGADLAEKEIVSGTSYSRDTRVRRAVEHGLMESVNCAGSRDLQGQTAVFILKHITLLL